MLLLGSTGNKEIANMTEIGVKNPRKSDQGATIPFRSPTDKRRLSPCGTLPPFVRYQLQSHTPAAQPSARLHNGSGFDRLGVTGAVWWCNGPRMPVFLRGPLVRPIWWTLCEQYPLVRCWLISRTHDDERSVFLCYFWKVTLYSLGLVTGQTRL